MTERRTIQVIEPALLRPDEAAQMLGMSLTMFKGLARSGRIGPLPIRLGAKCVRWSRQSLIDWVASGCPSRERWMELGATPRVTAGPRLADSA